MAGRRQFRIGGEAVDVGQVQAGVGDRLLDRRQRMGGQRNVGRARDLGKTHAADRHLAPVLPHGRLPQKNFSYRKGRDGYAEDTKALLPIATMAYPLRPSRYLTNRNCGSVMSSFNFSKTTSTRRPTFAWVYSASSRLPAISAPGASSSSTMMLA